MSGRNAPGNRATAPPGGGSAGARVSGERAAWLRLLPAIAALAMLAACLSPPEFDPEAWRREVAQTNRQDVYKFHGDHLSGFFNPWLPEQHAPLRFWRWMATENTVPRVQEELTPPPPVKSNDGRYLSDKGQPFSITSLGHATFAMQSGSHLVLTDPVFSRRAAVVSREVPPPFGPEKIPAGTVVLISHNHYDHLDGESVTALGGKAHFLCPLGLSGYLTRKGAKSVREMDWWETIEFEGARFTCLPAQHWSRRFLQGRNMTLWCSWLVEQDGHSVYYGGDSGYFKGFKEIGLRYPNIDVALLPIGANEPRWFMHYPHMDVAEALQAFTDLYADWMIPTQWGVFKLGDEPAGWPLMELERALAADQDLKARVKVLPVGGRFSPP